MNSADFEQHLKQLRPVNCDDRLAETFYQSGWQACEKSLAVRNTTNVSAARTLPTFVTGLVCGLTLWAFAFLMSSPTEPTTAIVNTKQQELPTVESASKPVMIEEVVAQVDLDQWPLVASQRWQIEDLFVRSPLLIEKPSPLSLAARHGWSSQVEMTSVITRSDSKEDRTGDFERDPLTISPVNNRLLQELML